MEKKARLKRVIVALCICLLVVGCVVVVQKYTKYRTEQKRLAQEPYYTEYKLTGEEMEYMCGYLWCESSPNWLEELPTEDHPDYTYVKLTPTETTEMVVTIMNDSAFCANEYEEELYLELEQNGVTEDSPFTVEWIMTHPKLAVKCVKKEKYVEDYTLLVHYYGLVTADESESVTE